MCTSPILIHTRSSVRSDRVTGLSVIQEISPLGTYRTIRGNRSSAEDAALKCYSKLRSASDDFFYCSNIVPCGKCAQCLSMRQSDLAARCAAEARKRGSMAFLTLTYSNETVPISVLLQKIDKSTGEIISDMSLRILDRPKRLHSKKSLVRYRVMDSDLRFECLRGFSALPRTAVKYFEKPAFCEDDFYQYRYVFSQSLCTKDVRLWLKRARMAYFREYSKHLPEFTYVVCGEYGERYHRPHYHLGFFGLKREHVAFLASLWDYGYSQLKMVNCINEDGSDGFARASKYIGKYMSKGMFECESVKLGFAAKGRLASSKGLGDILSASLVAFYRGYDIVGEYDINKPLPNEKLKALLSVYRQRNSITIGNSVFVLPRKYVTQIWSVPKKPSGFVSSVVRRQINESLRADYLNDRFEQLKELCPGEPVRVLFEKAFSAYKDSLLSLQVKNARGIELHKKFYIKSKF